MGALEAPTYAVAEANSRKLEKLDTLATAADLSALSDAEQSHANALSAAVGNLASKHATAAASIRADIAEVRDALSAGGGGVDAVLARLDTLFCDPAIDTYLSTPGLTAANIDGWLQNANVRDAFARSVRAPYGLSYVALPAETWCALITSATARSLLDANDPGWWRILTNNGNVLQAIIASSTAMQVVAASSTASAALNASLLKQTITKASSGWQGGQNEYHTLVSGRGIFLHRYDAYQNGKVITANYAKISIDGVVIDASNINHYARVHAYQSSIGVCWYQEGSYVQYIPL